MRFSFFLTTIAFVSFLGRLGFGMFVQVPLAAPTSPSYDALDFLRGTILSLEDDGSFVMDIKVASGTSPLRVVYSAETTIDVFSYRTRQDGTYTGLTDISPELRAGDRVIVLKEKGAGIRASYLFAMRGE